jgi:transposase-like protein
MRKTKKYAFYTLEEKERILELYMSGKKNAKELALEYGLDQYRRIYRWRDMKLKYGKIVDRRGNKVEGGKPKGRKPKSLKYEDMTREELIQALEMRDDLKKAMAYLRNQEKNIK